MWDLENLNAPTEFTNPFDKKGKEKIYLRLASDEDNKNFFDTVGVKEKVYWKTNPQTRGMQRVKDFDPTPEERDMFNEEVWDFSIVDWVLFDKEKNLIPCTRENKCTLMRKSPKFANWVASCLEQLRESIEVIAESERKNS
jgi:hypothetical protein